MVPHELVEVGTDDYRILALVEDACVLFRLEGSKEFANHREPGLSELLETGLVETERADGCWNRTENLCCA